jgi:uncharacterized LabA/DUF88 family protein
VTDFVNSVRKNYDGDYRLLRIYYYDSPPSNVKTTTPVSHAVVDFETNPQFISQTKLLETLRRTDFISVREGRVAFRGWKLKRIPDPSQPLTDANYKPDFEQKGVDTKIGLDIAWISMGKIAQRIYFVTGDSDFVPAMKFARRSGVQVFLFTLAHGVGSELKDHADVLIEKSIKTFLTPPSPPTP